MARERVELVRLARPPSVCKHVRAYVCVYVHTIDAIVTIVHSVTSVTMFTTLATTTLLSTTPT